MRRAASTNKPARRRASAPKSLSGPASWQPAATIEGLLQQGKQALISERMLTAGTETANLQELVSYGIKGVVAYAYPCQGTRR